MKNMQFTMVCAASMLLAACAGEPVDPAAGADDGSDDGDIATGDQAGASDTGDTASPEEAGLVLGGVAGCKAIGAKKVSVASASELANAIEHAACGQEIVLAKGTYGAAISVNVSCTDDKPLIIRSARRLGATMTAGVSIAGSNVCVAGLRFKGENAKVVVAGTDHTVAGNDFTDWTGVAVTARKGEGVEIAYNELHTPHAWLDPKLVDSQLRMGIRTLHDSAADFHYDGWVHHNYFHDFPAKPDPNNYHSGQSDAMEICANNTPGLSDGKAKTGWVVERNLIANHKGGDGVADFKCGGATVRYNTLIDSPRGRIDFRNGPNGKLLGNWIENSGGISVFSGNHQVFGNRLINTGAGITVVAGSVEWNVVKQGELQRAYKVHLAGNKTNKVIVGETYDNKQLTLPALDTLIEANEGPAPVKEFAKGTVIKSQTSVTVPVAHKLAPADVGPAAMP